MTSLDFLYIALGGGFVLLVIFLCVMLLHLILVLRDVTKVTANFTAISDRLREAVLEPMKTLSEMTAGLGFVHDLIEKIRRRAAEAEIDDLECEEEAECAESKKSARDSAQETKKTAQKGGIFSVKKVRK